MVRHTLSWEEGGFGPDGRSGKGPQSFSSYGCERVKPLGPLQTGAILSATSSWHGPEQREGIRIQN